MGIPNITIYDQIKMIREQQMNELKWPTLLTITFEFRCERIWIHMRRHAIP